MGFTDPYGNVNNRRCGLIAATVLFLMGAPVSAQRVAVGNYSWNLVDDWMNSVSANVTAPWAPSYMTTYTTFGVLVGNMTTLLYKNSVGLSFDWSKLLFIGSASQWVSAAMIYRAMDLATARDTPNTPISTYLTLAPGLRNVTLRQLVSYTGGIQGSDSCSESGLLTRVGLTTPLAMDACIDSIISSNNVSTAAQLPQGPPGSRYHFNGASMQLAAAVAMSARAARRDSYDHTQWAQLVGVNLRDLLGITPGMVYYMPNNNPSITSGLRMRAEDYGTFLRWYLNGSFMLPGSLFGFYRMEDDHTPDSAGVASAFSPLPADPYASLFHVGAGERPSHADGRGCYLFAPSLARSYHSRLSPPHHPPPSLQATGSSVATTGCSAAPPRARGAPCPTTASTRTWTDLCCTGPSSCPDPTRPMCRRATWRAAWRWGMSYGR